MEQQIKYLARQKRIKSAMNVATCVDPVDETVVDDDDISEEHLKSLAEAYGTGAPSTSEMRYGIR